LRLKSECQGADHRPSFKQASTSKAENQAGRHITKTGYPVTFKIFILSQSTNIFNKILKIIAGKVILFGSSE